MTGVHAGGTSGHRSGRRQQRSWVWRYGTPVVAVLSGALFVTSAVDSQGTDLRPERYSDLASVVEGEVQDYHQLEEHRKNLAAEVDRLTADVRDSGVRRAQGRIAKLKDPAGLVPQSGPGISVTLSDAPDDVLDAAIDRDNINLNRLVVHQQDIQAVVNALWLGGAKAVTIAGQRVVSTTGIKCEGNAVQLQGVPYPQPYVIKAVGDPAALESSVLSDALVAGYRSDAANPEIAVGWEMSSEEQVDAPAYAGSLDLRYAKPIG